MLCYWEGNDYQILRVDLTSANHSKAEDLRKNFRRLRRRVENVFKFYDIEDFVIETTEGNGVLHMIWAWKPKNGFKQRTFYIPHKWLKKEWEKIHGAYRVYIKQYDKSSSRTRNRVSGYLVSQYMAKQPGFVRYSYSWRRSLGFPLVQYWLMFKDYWLNYVGVDYKEMLAMWEYFLQGKRLPDLINKGRWFLTIDQMRGRQIT
jgi:hypothetical protein